MSSYHDKFVYKNYDSADNNLIIANFSADSGEVDSFLSMEPIYSEKYDGSLRYDYGAKYNAVSIVRITVIKNDYSDFTIDEFRNLVKHITGAKKSTWLDLYNKNDNDNYGLSYSFLCKCTNLQQYKMDSRVIGVTLEFTSVSPWAYSPVVTIDRAVNGSATISVNNQSDDIYSYVYPNIIFRNTAGNTLRINNSDTSDVTEIINLKSGETVTISNNQIISSSIDYKIFGDDFNFVWPKFAPGVNNLVVTGNGNIAISYRYPIKVGDCIK